MIRCVVERKQWLSSSSSTLHRLLASTTTAQATIETPVVIVGGGPSGLMLSHLLLSYQVPFVLLEAQSPQFHHPQAHFLNTRTMEILHSEVPTIYEQVRAAMPPVEQWKYVQFGYSASSGIMARVNHPVDVPFGIGDANGILLPPGQITAPPTTPAPSTTALSGMAVGHLAQHTFSRILYDEAMANTNCRSNILYNTQVTNVNLQDDNQYLVTTATGMTVKSQVVVAADGSNSILRQIWNIGWNGQEGIQDLVNVHFTTSAEAAARLPPAMLYSIFSPQLVGMMICHSPGEYVLQIPYFPPYQTVERDFNASKVQEIVDAALGFSDQSIQIKSIKTWKMSSLIASKYQSGSGGVLIGDAAHVFPPAGGFGMNTGLQDAHALAWRLAKHYHTQNHGLRIPILPSLQDYSRERRPIAQQNAALSVRNYQRILHLTKACYLNDQHPAAVIAMLNGISGILSLEHRQSIFANLVKVAMWPLGSLTDPNHVHARHLTNNVRSILKNGGGLPLLFPQLELGFGYGDTNLLGKDISWKDDTKAYNPVLKEGYLFPHVEMRVISGQGGRFKIGSTISSSDLPAKLRSGRLPCYALIVFGLGDDLSDMIQRVQEQSPATSLQVIRIIPPASSSLQANNNELILQDINDQMSSLLVTVPIIAVVRPDGHVSTIIKEFANIEATLVSILRN